MRFSRTDHWLDLQSQGATPAAATSLLLPTGLTTLFRKRAATNTDGGEGVSASYPSCEGGYSHSCPMGKVPLGYNSQMGTDGGSVWDLAGRKERENSPSDRLTDVLQRVFFFSTTTQSGIFSSAMQNESELYSFFLQHLRKIKTLPTYVLSSSFSSSSFSLPSFLRRLHLCRWKHRCNTS